jgi:hypothetical protein
MCNCLLLLLLQAGILQGEVDSLMVMDQWQASLMRALAQLQLKSSPEARAAVAAKFDMDESTEGLEQQPGAVGDEDDDEDLSSISLGDDAEQQLAALELEQIEQLGGQEQIEQQPLPAQDLQQLQQRPRQQQQSQQQQPGEHPPRQQQQQQQRQEHGTQATRPTKKRRKRAA